MNIGTKFAIILTSVVFSSIVLSNDAFAQEEDFLELQMTQILGGQDKESFFVQEGRNLSSNRINLSLLQQSNNNILIPHGFEAIINGEPTPNFSTIFVEGTLKITKTQDEPLKVQKNILKNIINIQNSN